AETYKKGEVTPTDSALVAAGVIVEMEDGQLPNFTPTQRLAAMRERLEELFQKGPEWNDWGDPALHPNVLNALEKAGLLSSAEGFDCYFRVAIPVKERSEELKLLQADLLTTNVMAGVIDGETARKAAMATANEAKPDYALEADIQEYQRKVRRVFRLLYDRGEVPSSFVKAVEKALDVEIVAFDPEKALRNDMRYYFCALLSSSGADAVQQNLEKRMLIPSARNHIGQFKWGKGHEEKLNDRVLKQTRDFEALLDGKADIVLPGDDTAKIARWSLPATALDYRLQMRKVCRALITTGLYSADQLKPIEETLGIPLVGTLENPNP
ncbi:MAG: hypothetical protein HY343_13410, partial [Lentisphaerae bacterium]|nr:hypothetical protein [Lentisphaerota bacterium]